MTLFHKTLIVLATCCLGTVTAAQAQDNVLVVQGPTEQLRMNVAAVSARMLQADDKQSRLALGMNDSASRDFAAFTQRMTGQMVAVSLCGHEILRATIQTQIDSGYIVSQQIDTPRAEMLAAVINNQQPCAD